MSLCAYCACEIEDGLADYNIHREPMDGPEVDLCYACGLDQTITCEMIWDRIAKERRPDLFPEGVPERSEG